MEDTEVSEHSAGRGRDTIGWVLVIIGILMVVIGAFVVVTVTRLDNFISCQAAYNQVTSDAREARLHTQSEELNNLYLFLKKTRRVLSPQRTAKDVKVWHQRLDHYIEAHQKNITSQQNNPYVSPKTFCGPNPQ